MPEKKPLSWYNVTINLEMGFMYEYYIDQAEEGIASKTETDLELIDVAPQEERPWLLWVFVKIKSPDEAGWCLEHESEVLLGLQKELVGAFEKKLDALLSGVRMQEGWMEFFFYAPTAKKFESVAMDVLKEFEGYAYETGSSRDSKWEHYLNTLYPRPLMMKQIESRYIIGELEDEGDDITLPREVEHYLFFQTPAPAKRIAEKLETEGFAVKEFVEGEGEYAHGVVLVKRHDVTEMTLMQVSTELINAVEAEHGIYEGWSTVLADV